MLGSKKPANSRQFVPIPESPFQRQHARVVAQDPPYGPAAFPLACAPAAPNARRGGKAARLESEPCATGSLVGRFANPYDAIRNWRSRSGASYP